MPFQLCYYHVIWATKNRLPILTPEIEALIFPLIQHKSIELNSPIQVINGVADHIHVAVSISTRLAPAEWVKQIKGTSAHEVNTTYPDLSTRFSWQQGYGILTFGVKALVDVCAYIEGQKEHHATQNIQPSFERTDD